MLPDSPGEAYVPPDPPVAPWTESHPDGMDSGLDDPFINQRSIPSGILAILQLVFQEGKGGRGKGEGVGAVGGNQEKIPAWLRLVQTEI